MNRFSTIKCLISLLLWVAVPMAAQKDDTVVKRNLACRFETCCTLGDGDFAPFWHTADRHGLSSVETKSALAHFAALGNMLMPNGFDMGYGVDVGAGVNMQSYLFIHQLYVDLDYKWLRLEIGMKEHDGELKNKSLSSGGLTWSGNSQPVPQIRLSIPEYTRIPVLDRWLSVKGHIAYGRFTDDRWRRNSASTSVYKDVYTDRILYHGKDLFLRFGDVDRFPLQVTVGLEMYSMFGGTIHNRFISADRFYDEYDFESGPKAYLNAFLPFNEAGNQGKENGNTLGSWHLSLDYTVNDWDVRAYYEHFFEDHSGMIGIEYKSDLDGNKDFVSYGFRRNWFDGLFGVEVSLPERFPVRGVVLEILNTRGQCGAIRRDLVYPVAESIDGRDDMYNHQLYDSYSLSGMAIGNPVLLSPVYNRDGYQGFRSNRVIMFHAGVNGDIGSHVDYRALFTTTRHWGTYQDPFDQTQKVTSCLLEGSYLFGGEYGWKVGMSVAFDMNDGDMTGNNTGIMITLSRLWKIL